MPYPFFRAILKHGAQDMRTSGVDENPYATLLEQVIYPVVLRLRFFILTYPFRLEDMTVLSIYQAILEGHQSSRRLLKLFGTILSLRTMMILKILIMLILRGRSIKRFYSNTLGTLHPLYRPFCFQWFGVTFDHSSIDSQRHHILYILRHYLEIHCS